MLCPMCETPLGEHSQSAMLFCFRWLETETDRAKESMREAFAFGSTIPDRPDRKGK